MFDNHTHAKDTAQEACGTQATVLQTDWARCRFLTCSVLPVRVACNLRCKFCFSKSSISALRHEKADWRRLPVEDYYRWARSRGANRLVITGGGEPLLRPNDVVHLVRTGKRFFSEITCFTNGTYLTPELSVELQEAGLNYLCFSRHHHDETRNLELMGEGAPSLNEFFRAVGDLRVRATCVMAGGYIDSKAGVWSYIDALRRFGVREFTFKHTYVSYDESVFGGSAEDRWAESHKIEFDPFEAQGVPLAALPWGPTIRRIDDLQVCYYREPTPDWERRNGLCRSSNLLSDGKVYASLEDQRSLLYQLKPSHAL